MIRVNFSDSFSVYACTYDLFDQQQYAVSVGPPSIADIHPRADEYVKLLKDNNVVASNVWDGNSLLIKPGFSHSFIQANLFPIRYLWEQHHIVDRFLERVEYNDVIDSFIDAHYYCNEGVTQPNSHTYFATNFVPYSVAFYHCISIILDNPEEEKKLPSAITQGYPLITERSIL